LFEDWKIGEFSSSAIDLLFFFQELQDLLRSSATGGNLPTRQSCCGCPLVREGSTLIRSWFQVQRAD
jgi:hypothetical protein